MTILVRDYVKRIDSQLLFAAINLDLPQGDAGRGTDKRRCVTDAATAELRNNRHVQTFIIKGQAGSMYFCSACNIS